MASAPAHAVAALALGAVMVRGERRWPILLAGAACAVLPDADVAGFAVGVSYGDLLGHRGLSHSLFFAAALAGLVTLVLGWRWRTYLYLFAATASHAVLDAFTDGGLGVAFFAPFSNQRFFFPVHPIAVAPISPRRFFGERGLAVLGSEALWIGLPALALFALAAVLRRRRRP